MTPTLFPMTATLMPNKSNATPEASALSRREQGGAGELATENELAAMNDVYEAKFGFRFVVFLAGRSKSGIVPVFRDRLQRTRTEELATGIDEFLAISRDRLERAAT